MVAVMPSGYHSVTPYLITHNAADAIDFYKRAFGASEIMRLEMPTGQVAHAEIQIGNSRVMLADEFPDMAFPSPKTLGGAAVSLMVYMDNVDARFDRAIAAGGKIRKPVADQFYGDRSGTLEDPFGHVWTLATHIEDVSQAEVQRRAIAMAREKVPV